jgi:hypothetical protein
MGGSISNGTSIPPQWLSGYSYVVGNTVISVANQQPYLCIANYSGTVDPSNPSVSASWVLTTISTYQQPVKIPYTPTPGNPYGNPQLVTVPTDIRVTPQLMPSIDHDPVIVVQGNDALPLTVLGLFLKYDQTSVP